MIHPRLDELFRQLERQGAEWCLLRLPSECGTEGGDVDLLVSRTGSQSVRQVLKHLGFVPLPGWEPGFHFLDYDAPTHQWIWLHIVTELSFGPDLLLQARSEAGCLSRRKSNGYVSVLAADDDFWLLLLHCLVDKGYIAPRHRDRLRNLVGEARPDGELAKVVAPVCPSGWNSDRILECVRKDRWRDLEQLGPVLESSWRRRSGVGAGRLLLHRLSKLPARVRNIPRARGLGVALLGPDGAGKSTLVDALRKSFPLPVSSVYMGLTGGYLPYADKLRVPPLVVAARLAIFWGRYLLAQYHQCRGRLVVFDRYIYDSEVPTPYPLNWLERAYRWIDGHACPGPDLVVVLNTPGAIMYERKGEYTPEILEDWRQRFLALERRVPNTEIVDSTPPREAVLLDLTDRVWRQYAARWGKD